MKTYSVKAWDGIMEWNAEYFKFEAENDETAEKIAEAWFQEDYLPEIILDPQSYSDYPDEDDYDSEEEYDAAVEEAENEMRASLYWEFL